MFALGIRRYNLQTLFFFVLTFTLSVGMGALVPLSASEVTGAASTDTITQRYKSAERFLNARGHVKNAAINHHWIGRTEQLWYAREVEGGREYILVNAENGHRQPAFEHKKLASLLSTQSGINIGPWKLNVVALNYDGAAQNIVLMLEGHKWSCNLSENQCSQVEDKSIPKGELVSPDRRWALFIKDYNLWLRSRVDGSIKQLTFDGEQYYAYGVLSGSSAAKMALKIYDISELPVALWSPDSTRIITHRLDERTVGEMPIVEYAPANGDARPVLHTYRLALPGDTHVPTAEMLIVELDGTQTKVSYEALQVPLYTPIVDSRVWWSDDNRKVYMVPREVYQKRQRMLCVDAETGDVDILIEEISETYVDVTSRGFGTPVIRILPNEEILWFSERDGWGHLYRYDAQGTLLNRVTSGAWQVRDIVYIDEVKSLVYFTAGGREPALDPYFEQLYSVKFDGSGLQRITKQAANYKITVPQTSYFSTLLGREVDHSTASFSPSGRYFISSYSRPDLPTITSVQRADGNLVSKLESADISKLVAGGFSMVEPFKVFASDGKTKLYGSIYRPGNFDPSRSYPVIDVIYPGPQSIKTPKHFMSAIGDTAQALAEIGFIVVTIDGRGTPYRSKVFHDATYGLEPTVDPIADHIAGLEQLAERFPYMDMNRVGVIGHSSGGAASARAILKYPEFFKVAVSASGSHQPQGSVLVAGATYLGPYSDDLYSARSNLSLAGNLKGKLLLVHGGLDDTVNMAQTMQLSQALVEANKDFDLLLLPTEPHSFLSTGNYYTRRCWDYFVHNLMGTKPPENYQIGR